MRIHHLSIANFRGIKRCDWSPPPGLVCLVGSGDSTKSTILDAISLCLSHRWNVDFGDADFYKGNPDNPIAIEIALTDLPPSLESVDTFAFALRGIDAEGGLTDEPQGGRTAVVIRLTVDRSLEPAWHVLSEEDEADPQRITALQRSHLGVLRISDHSEQHLRWARDSALSRLTGNREELPLILAEAQRSARSAVFRKQDPALLAAAKAAQDLAKNEQLPTPKKARAGLDPWLHLRAGQLSLHAGDLPVETLGLGSRRLLAIAVQRETGRFDQNVMVIDEIEHGLEPHRLRGLIYRLRSAAEGSQVFITTHSPVSLQNLSIEEVGFVKAKKGITSITMIPHDLADPDASYQKIARSVPSALLADKIVVAEGATEKGVAWALLERFGNPTGSSASSVAMMNGEGTKPALVKARQLAVLGYDVLAFVDGDHELADDDLSEALDAGVKVVHWPDGHDLEAQLFSDLPADRLDTYVRLAIESNLRNSDDPAMSIRDQTSALLEGHVLSGMIPSEWLLEGVDESELRQQMGAAAHKKGWFKKEYVGYQLGELLADDWDGIKTTDLHAGLRKVRKFVRRK